MGGFSLGPNILALLIVGLLLTTSLLEANEMPGPCE